MAGLPEEISNKKLAGLDLLRTIAITIVFFWHYALSGGPKWVQAIGDFGWSGVDLFFVLSGYLIGAQLLSNVVKTNHIPFRDFYLKRF